MANLNKIVTVAFEEMLEGFEDQLVMSKLARTYRVGDQLMERSADVIWRPQPYVFNSVSGLDVTASMSASSGVTQLAVPATIGFVENALFKLSATELRDENQVGYLMNGAKQILATRINLSVQNVAAEQGSLFIKRGVSATGFDDISLCDNIMNEQGVPNSDRKLALASVAYNAMASTLGRPQTSGLDKASKAFERAYLGQVAGFDTIKLDYAYRLSAALGTTVSITNAGSRYVPVANVTNANGTLNVDNRFQTLAITVVSGVVKVGDAFTIAGVNAVHHITKADTGSLKTFRITSIVTGAGGTGTVQITPPIIAADSAPTVAELQYKNVTATPAAAAAVTFLNTTTGLVSPFWAEDAIEVLPSRLMPMDDSGLAIARGTTPSGYELLLTRQAAIGDLSTQYRVTARWGVVNKQPEMSGIIMFNQA